MLAYLLGLDTIGLGEDPTHLGKALETFVACELLKMSGWSSATPTLHHYRTVGGAEVDLVLEAYNSKVVGVEVKATHVIKKRDLAGLKSLAADASSDFACGVILPRQ